MNASDIARFEAKVDRSGGPDACHLWLGETDHGGYGRFFISKRYAAHRVAFLLAYGRWPEPQCCHSCDVRYPKEDRTYRRCCNQSHLWEGTNADNQADMVAKGRSARGERSRQAKLTEAEALALLALRGTMLQREAAALFEIGQPQVSRIWNGRRWSHVER